MIELKLKEIRESRNLKPKAVVEQLGISRITLWQWENGKRSPSIEYLNKLSKIYECSIDDFIKGV
jgi:transcriptional regulator with XRE-family HTH domain